MATPEVITPINGRGNPMSPYEAATGVVLSLWTPGSGGTPSRHHPHFFKPDFEQGPLDKRGFLRAVRFSRLQLIGRGVHTKLHRETEGTLFPTDASTAFHIALLNKAKYVAPFIVDMSRTTAIRETTPAMRDALHQPGILTMERSRSRVREIASFMMQFSIEQFVLEDTSLAEEFIGLPSDAGLTTPQKQRRTVLGTHLLNTAMSQVVDPWEEHYQASRAIGALREGSAPTAIEEVKAFVEGHEHHYFDTLKDGLTTRLDEIAA